MQLLKNVFNLFFSDVCLNCKLQLSENETLVCTQCRHDFPQTNFTNNSENQLEKKFYGRIPLNAATSLFYYHKNGKIQQIIHQLKYKSQQKIGTLFGNWLGEEIAQSNRFNNIDYIVTVPLHPKKKKTRGYNQLTKFGKALSEKLNSELIEDKLIKIESTETQTHKGRVERWRNTQHLFELSDTSFFENKHVLLIDDVVTTGATIETCANQLLKTKSIKISVAVMAFTE
ncbi:MAG: ComF family protein [Flavobacteriaceae bacterium]|nr:ComF family protein [Flavobacteriaceae bacterium]